MNKSRHDHGLNQRVLGYMIRFVHKYKIHHMNKCKYKDDIMNFTLSIQNFRVQFGLKKLSQ